MTDQAVSMAKREGSHNALMWLSLELEEIGRYESISVGRVLDMIDRYLDDNNRKRGVKRERTRPVITWD